MKSQKLVRTLSELESAFTSWQSLSSAKARQAATAAPLKKDTAKAADPAEEEFKQKTKKLLDQLRQQLAELND